MKNQILILALLLISSMTLKAQEEINLVLSFRPSIGASASKSKPDSTPTGQTFSELRRKSSRLNFNLSVELPTKKDFYHFPVVGFRYLNTTSLSDRFFTIDQLLSNSKDKTERLSFLVGYGVGKYIYIHKENLFVNLKNNLAFQYAMNNSKGNQNTYDTAGQKVFTFESETKKPATYSLFYELNPAIGYRIKNISLSLGIPLDFGLNISNGKEIRTSESLDLVSGLSNSNKDVQVQKATSFNFSYGFELSFRYHFKKSI